MEKIQYTLQLDPEIIGQLDKMLEVAGMTRSGFINSLCVQVVESMNLGKSPNIKNMTLPQALKILGNLGEMMSKK